MKSATFSARYKEKAFDHPHGHGVLKEPTILVKSTAADWLERLKCKSRKPYSRNGGDPLGIKDRLNRECQDRTISLVLAFNS